ncbi:prolipoprotein diacylglyceryl transferase [Clostridium beijerinckii]|jgi:prolipoprotein diacylglyceryl transferase|uniref:Phosphatidylglycerol--prolipoprotein diacylglyceryl transferase n=2 Tax=Clostridium beijerinckii TaxID=1520 RepID=A0AAE2RVC3_CLOBE|nr:prolipoprotein diacylglyceryl transferase [Clostridium beijerinckii]ABR35111.1 prolipoprotein diacylglyceryl transferase [Clostridium beijerinckii NCIMB 8052]AIU03195.1 prolipoprotein diacylglyceryl transferase [Clostridium beijerinckii ATCC 35702]MBF7810258.1 prolipoprotein diacylglyceryl transferase [Clostridium beijerinckii]NRT23502.1 phosphatidylglycerol:prolipoprotein diacylglycerol transferase [Clostridium beijerinckii]NRT68925.1 phosphatidylglycerol:prolipoprotein diacylglycerol tran
MKELFSFGPIHIYFFGLMIAVAAITGGAFAIKQGEKRGINEDIIFNLIFIVVIAGVLGARLFYILFYNPSFYFSNPGEIFKINEGGLSIHGGIVSAVLAGYIYSIKSKISFLKLADIAVVGIALAQGIGRVGCDVFGKPMANIMIWGINYNGQLLHPAQVYEFILDYILFIVLWRRSYKKKFEGELFIIYLIAFAIIRGIVEFFRINPVIWGPFSISHLLSLALVSIGLAIYILLAKRNTESQRIYVEDNKLKVTTSIIILAALILVSIFVFYFVQG